MSMKSVEEEQDEDTETKNRKRKQVELTPLAKTAEIENLKSSPVKTVVVKKEKSGSQERSPAKQYKQRVEKRVKQKRIRLSDGVPPVDANLIEPLNPIVRALDFKSENTSPNMGSSTDALIGGPQVDKCKRLAYYVFGAAQ